MKEILTPKRIINSITGDSSPAIITSPYNFDEVDYFIIEYFYTKYFKKVEDLDPESMFYGSEWYYVRLSSLIKAIENEFELNVSKQNMTLRLYELTSQRFGFIQNNLEYSVFFFPMYAYDYELKRDILKSYKINVPDDFLPIDDDEPIRLAFGTELVNILNKSKTHEVMEN